LASPFFYGWAVFAWDCTLLRQNLEIANLKQVITELTEKVNSSTLVQLAVTPNNVNAVQLPVNISTNTAN